MYAGEDEKTYIRFLEYINSGSGNPWSSDWPHTIEIMVCEQYLQACLNIVTLDVRFNWTKVEDNWLLVPRNQWGNILTAVEWQQAVTEVNKFHATLPDEIIDEINNTPNVSRDGHSSATTADTRSTPTDARTPKSGFVYIMGGSGYCKIGLSVNPKVRLEQVGSKMPYNIELIHTIPTNDMYNAEKYLHRMFASQRAKGEWFELSQEDVAWIKNCKELMYA